MDKPSASLQPLYLKVKRHILENIGSGKWGTSTRVPSENEIVKSFGVSRMTANRALRELRDEGIRYGSRPTSIYALSPRRPRGMDLVHGLRRWMYRLILSRSWGCDWKSQTALCAVPSCALAAVRAPLPLSRETVYHITVTQSRDAGSAKDVTVDGVPQDDTAIPLVDDRQEHTVEVRRYEGRCLSVPGDAPFGFSSDRNAALKLMGKWSI